CGSLALAAVLAGLSATLWAALGHSILSPTQVGQEFFLTVAACWAVLVPAKIWSNHRGDSWARRVIMMVLGVCIGLEALWLEGWVPRLVMTDIALAAGPGSENSLPFSSSAKNPNLAGCLSYFALAFFALRWWKLADR